MNVASKENLKEKLLEVLGDLPEESQIAVIDYADFLREKNRRNGAATESRKERVAGLHDGQGWISDDFNDELPDVSSQRPV